MQYLSGMKALNIPCALTTTGDWHLMCFNWNENEVLNTKNSIFKNYGIERNKKLPNGQILNVANHIRACLDMISNSEFANAQGMKNDYICTNEYNNEIFKNIIKLRNQSNWNDIDQFMCKEYKLEWINFKEKRNIK